MSDVRALRTEVTRLAQLVRHSMNAMQQETQALKTVVSRTADDVSHLREHYGEGGDSSRSGSARGRRRHHREDGVNGVNGDGYLAHAPAPASALAGTPHSARRHHSGRPLTSDSRSSSFARSVTFTSASRAQAKPPAGVEPADFAPSPGMVFESIAGSGSSGGPACAPAARWQRACKDTAGALLWGAPAESSTGTGKAADPSSPSKKLQQRSQSLPRQRRERSAEREMVVPQTASKVLTKGGHSEWL